MWCYLGILCNYLSVKVLKWFNELLKVNPFDYALQTFFMFWINGLGLWAYYNSVTIKNDPITKPPPSPDTRDMDPLYKVH